MPFVPVKPLIKQGIRAFHGSPHDFDKFSMDQIGTGEGAQAYGHGLYFAEEMDVAKGYQPRSYDAEEMMLNRYKGAETKQNYLEMEAWERAMMHETPAELRAYAAENLKNAERETFNRVADELNTFPREGSLVEVNINADPDDFLDWDKPLSEQPKKIQDLLNNNEIAHADAHAHQRGAEIYRNTSNPLTEEGSDAAAKALREAGIPGIKYLDGGSRGKGEGTYNYVVFDEKNIEIIRKYGIAGAIASGLLTLSTEDEARAAGIPVKPILKKQSIQELVPGFQGS